MKYEEYKSKIEEAVKNPDKIGEVALSMLDGIKEDLANVEGLTQELDKYKARVTELLNTNANLFLKMQSNERGSVEKDPEPDPIGSLLKSQFEGGKPIV